MHLKNSLHELRYAYAPRHESCGTAAGAARVYKRLIAINKPARAASPVNPTDGTLRVKSGDEHGLEITNAHDTKTSYNVRLTPPTFLLAT